MRIHYRHAVWHAVSRGPSREAEIEVGSERERGDGARGNLCPTRCLSFRYVDGLTALVAQDAMAV